MFSRLCMVFALLTIVSGFHHVFAWDNHQEMTSLTKFDMDKVDLVKYAETIVKESSQPDKNKSWDHSIAMRKRALDACNGAISSYKAKQDNNSAEQLAHCLHYLQDIGDPTKEIDNIFHIIMNSRKRKENLRSIAQSLLSKNSKTPITTEAEWKNYYPSAHKYFDLMNVETVLNITDRLKSESIRELGSICRQRIDENQKRDRIKASLIRCIANNVAAQNRIVELLVE